jgi:hypothetical protein
LPPGYFFWTEVGDLVLADITRPPVVVVHERGLQGPGRRRQRAASAPPAGRSEDDVCKSAVANTAMRTAECLRVFIIQLVSLYGRNPPTTYIGRQSDEH